MTIGINRAIELKKSFSERYVERKNPCIFLSHRSLDKDMVRKIGEYITKAGIDIYLDENDSLLQDADASGNDQVTVSCIQRGLMESTHVLCILSRTTVSSWWVPYEIGYAEKGAKGIASLKISNLKKEEIPSYLRIKECLMGIKELNRYLLKVGAQVGLPIENIPSYNYSEYNLRKNASIIQESYSYHPLRNYLDQ
ncbi:toll/interleukin-1 receptor domain-containing protein [Tissierella sp.]|uniref:toll/interleukin-1 receptor domain-containing protein n=1 Tax=Tissierella sp. TaxID=41274 RepID=UPI00304C9B95